VTGMSNSKWSTRVDDKNPVHTCITVFNHGGNSGQLCVNTEDAFDLQGRLTCTPVESEVMRCLQNLYGVYTRSMVRTPTFRMLPDVSQEVGDLMQAYSEWLGQGVPE